MITNDISGLGLIVISGIMLGCAVVPMKYATKWKWENIWLLNTTFALVVIPALVVLRSVPNAWEVYRLARPSAVVTAILLGFGWGIGSILSGIGYTLLGVGLGASIILGLASSLGLLIPLVVLFPSRLLSSSALTLYLGVAVMLVGVILTARAGKLRQAAREARAAVSKPDLRSFGKGDIGIGLLVCVGSGVLSSMFNLALAFGDDIRVTATRLGASPMGAVNTLWFPVELAAFAANLIYCGYLLTRNRTWSSFMTPGGLSHWLIGAVMAALWMGSISVYGLGAGRLGQMGAVAGFPTYISMSIVTANSAGFVTHEWTGAPRAAYLYGLVGMLILVASVVVIGIAGQAVH
jgi:L-rhamnose-H+ transport protein